MDADLVDQLCSVQKLERDRGAVRLNKQLSECSSASTSDLEARLHKLLMDDSVSWETRHGCYMGMRALVEAGRGGDNSSLTTIRDVALEDLTHDEVRVRQAAGEFLGGLCRKLGSSVYDSCKDKVLGLIASNLERDIPSSPSPTLSEGRLSPLTTTPSYCLTRRGSTEAAQIFHESAGWRFLETSMRALQSMAEGCGSQFTVDDTLLKLLYQSVQHTNRFVRETGFHVMASLLDCEVHSKGDGTVAKEMSERLGAGLSDNWSQVRLAASVATRKFLLALPEDARSQFLPVLLPRMCLNRYYVAEGVRIYSLDTWKQVAGNSGKDMVEKHIDDVVSYYCKATESDNHAVREASCTCIAEVASKLSKEVVMPHVKRLLTTLVQCFRDDSWPVRDAACLACGNFILCFPDESRDFCEDLYPLFYQNLEDPIASVRQGAAAAIANLVKAYKKEAVPRIVEKLKAGLLGVLSQPNDSHKYDSLEPVATFGVVKRRRDNPFEQENKQMYSCGSLAPKMGRSGGGCIDHKFKKPSEPWELADGCVYLLGELSSISEASAQVEELLPVLAKAANHREYYHHVNLLESLCKALPLIGKGIGKKAFKQHMDLFFDSLFYSLSCENALTSSAASQCLTQLSTFLGPRILRGRVEMHNSSYVPQLDANAFIAPF